MTTIAHTPDRIDIVAPTPIRRQSFRRLISVETRKLVDIRSGIALLALCLLIAVGGLGWILVENGSTDPSFGHYAVVMQGVGMVLPIIGLLGMTAEWTQRTALTTFTLSPRRGRVIAAKFVASLVLALLTFVVVMALVLVAVLIGAAISGQPADFTGTGGGLRSLAITTVLQVTMAAGVGALVAQTAVAVGAYLLAPTIVTLLATKLLGDNAKWTDVFGAYGRLASAHPWADLGPTIVSVLLWVGVPAVVGVLRSLRREVK